MSMESYIVLGGFLFAIGLYGLLSTRNLMRILISLEVMLNAVNVIVASIAVYSGTMDGIILALFIIALSAAETAVGIALIISLYRKFDTIDLNKFTDRRW